MSIERVQRFLAEHAPETTVTVLANGSPSHRQSWLAAKPTIDNFAGRLSGVGTPGTEILGSGKRMPHMHAFTAGSEQATGIGCSEIFAQTS